LGASGVIYGPVPPNYGMGDRQLLKVTEKAGAHLVTTRP
jgi:hypothetical protein